MVDRQARLHESRIFRLTRDSEFKLPFYPQITCDRCFFDIIGYVLTFLLSFWGINQGTLYI